MKFLANENFPFKSYLLLKAQGWDIEHIGENNVGIMDEEVIEYSKKEERIIITFDSDYGELVFKNKYQPRGVIYLRIRDFAPDYPAELLKDLIIEKSLPVDGRFTVIDDRKIRQKVI